MTELLHPELLAKIPFAKRIKSAMAARAMQVATQESTKEPGVTIVVRSLNERKSLESLFEDIEQQDYNGDIQVVVVDNESTDGTPEFARSKNAEVATIKRDEFTYPKSMNIGMHAADNDLVFMTVAHANLSTTQLLRASVLPFMRNDTVGGVYSDRTLPGRRSSVFERTDAARTLEVIHGTGYVEKVRLGTLACIGAMIAKPIWGELGEFDEQYEAGGEDTVMAQQMLAHGYQLWRELGSMMHHSHGLGFVRTIEQGLKYAKSVSGPMKLNKEGLKKYRPHLDLS